MKKSTIAVIVVAAVLAGATLFFAGLFFGPTLMGSYGHGDGCWGARGHGAPAATSAAWMCGGTSHSKEGRQHRGCCGCPSHR